MAANPEIKKLEKSALFLLHRAGQYAADVYVDKVPARGLTPRQFAVMLTINQNEGLSQADLVEKIGIDRSTLADMISRLTAKQYVQKKRTKEDARAFSLKLSAAGKRVLAQTQPGASATDKKVLSSLSGSERKAFLAALKKISEEIENN